MVEQVTSDPLALVKRLRSVGGLFHTEDVANAIEAILHRYSWRSIETAPSETEVLVRFPPIVHGGRDFMGVAEKTFGAWHKPGNNLDEVRFPTHWMPLPESPR